MRTVRKVAGGCTWSQGGVYLVPGEVVYLVLGGVPGPGEVPTQVPQTVMICYHTFWDINNKLFVHSMTENVTFVSSLKEDKDRDGYLVAGSAALKGKVRTSFRRQRLVFHKFSQQCQNANISNFVLVVPLEMNKTNEVYNIEI